MKKCRILFLTMIVCLLLTACGAPGTGATDSSTPDGQEIEELLGRMVNNINCIVQVSINPEFELYLDECGVVCELKCLNEDAVNAFNGADVLGKSCDEVIEMLLNAAKDGGYLTGESNVTMTVVLREDSELKETIAATLETAVQKFVDAEKCTMRIWDGRTQREEGSQIGHEEPAPNSGTQSWTEEVRNAEGKLVSRTEKQNVPEGVMVITEYFAENGNLSKRVEELNGSVVAVSEYDAAGRRISRVQEMVSGDGVKVSKTSTYSYYDDGSVSVEEIHGTDGSYAQVYYYKGGYETGRISREYHRKANGSYTENRYDEDGNLTASDSREYDNLGGYSVWTDNPDGTKEQYYYAADGSVWFNWFDANGTQLGQKQVQ